MMSGYVWTTNDFKNQIDEATQLRKDRKFPQAIEKYNQIILNARQYSPEFLSEAYARRGAAKLALGFHSVHDPRASELAPKNISKDDVSRGAIEDLTLAVEGASGEKNGWAWAQLGEAHRSFARDHFRLMSEQRFKIHIDTALDAFGKAEQLVPEHRAWLLAHKGATHFHSVWRYQDIDTLDIRDLFKPINPKDEQHVREAKKHVLAAEQCFKEALDERPKYAWAKRFRAFLFTCLGKYDQAERELKEALAIDENPYLQVTRSMAMLYRYRAEEQPQGSAEREESLQRALLASQDVMECDSDDFFAMYAYAAASADMKVADAAAICREARDGILNQVVRGILMAFALHREGNAGGKFSELLDDTINKFMFDPEIIIIAEHDPLGEKGNLLRAFQADWAAR